MDQEKPKVFRQFLAITVANVAYFNHGAMLSYSSPVGVLMSSQETSDLVLNSEEIGWLASSFQLGGLFGLPLGAVLLRKLGRKNALVCGSLMSSVGWTVIYLAQVNFAVLVGRFLCGVMTGVMYIAESAYTTEIASPTVRGILGSQNSFIMVLGMNFLGLTITFMSSWRAVAGVFVFVSLVQCVSMFFNYETPVYLLMRNQEEKARQTLQKLRGSRFDISSELSEMKRLADRTREQASSILHWAKLKRPHVYKPFAFGIALALVTAGFGSVPMIGNMETILQEAGAEFEQVGLAIIIFGAIRLPCTFLLSIVNDKLGRKKITAITGILSGVFQILLGLCFVLKAESKTQYWVIQLARTSLFFILSSNIMMSTTTFVIIGELLTPDVKEVCGMAIYLIYFAANCFLTATFFPIQEIVPIHVIFWIYGFFAFLTVAFVGHSIPETKGKSLETINNHFREKSVSHADLSITLRSTKSLNMAAIEVVELLPTPRPVYLPSKAGIQHNNVDKRNKSAVDN